MSAMSATAVATETVGAATIPWQRYPHIVQIATARDWLTRHARRNTANTLLVYARGLEDFLAFCALRQVEPERVTPQDVAAYVHQQVVSACDQRTTQTDNSGKDRRWARETHRVRLTPVRLYYDDLLKRGLCSHNPVRGSDITLCGWLGSSSEHRRAGEARGAQRIWVPRDDQWQAIVEVMRGLSIRDRLLFALAYDGALRSAELCNVRLGDFAQGRQLTIHTARGAATAAIARRIRTITYSPTSAHLLQVYLRQRPARHPSHLFLLASHRTRAQPITPDTWRAVVRAVRHASGVSEFSAPTLRHLKLVDLAHAGWDRHRLATFAGLSIRAARAYLSLARQPASLGTIDSGEAEKRMAALLLSPGVALDMPMTI